MYAIEEINLDNVDNKKDVMKFLNQFDLEYENDIDYSIAVYNNGSIVATASKSKNVLKCFAILEDYQGLGLTNTLIKKIEDRMFKEGLYHFFIFTPSYNRQIFSSVGYKEIITSNGITILENGNRQIETFLTRLKKENNISDHQKACIVMNGNPFTLGHQFLIEEASSDNDELIVFVVRENKSSFPFDIRIRLIKEGTKHLENVRVIETGPYLISQITFPTYFLKKNIDVVKIQTNIDCDIFLKYYKPIFNINKRYIGTEPYCEITKTYNQMMKETLPKNGVEVIEICRKKIEDDCISASKVRTYIKNNQLNEIKSLVPKSTYEFLISDEAKPIINNIKKGQGRH